MRLRRRPETLEASADVVPSSPRTVGNVRGGRSVVRSGTALEVAELAWIGEGITRELALTIPTMLACRNLVIGTVVQLELFRYRGGERLEPDWLVSKPDPSTTMPATLGGTVDDLAFTGRAYWRVLERDSDGYPRRARWTPVADVTPETRSLGGSYDVLTGYRVAGLRETVPVDGMIRFDSPIPGILDVAGRTLAAALELEAAARRLSGVELPAGVLHNDGAEVGQDEAEAIVGSFETTRREHGVAFLQGMTYSRESLSAADLQLIEARANVATDVARLWNVPVAMVGASPSGNASALLYSNLSQTLAILVSSAVAPHLHTIEATLTEAYPRGTSIAFDVQTFLRSDPAAAADYVIALKGAGLVDVAEGRSMLGIQTAPAPVADLTPGRP